MKLIGDAYIQDEMAAVVYERQTMKEVRIYNGQSGRKVMPHSEVCMFMRIADKPMYFRFEIRGYLNNGIDGIAMVQLFDPLRPTEHFSSPILASEAGIYRDNLGFYYYAE